MSKGFLDKMTEIATPIIEKEGCELVDAEFKKEGASKVLRFYIELAEGRISLDKLADTSEKLSAAFDEAQESDGSLQKQGAYILEVSSPGVERILNKEKDYIRFSGDLVDVSLFSGAKTGKKKFVAKLVSYDPANQSFHFESEGEDIRLELSEVAKINLYFEF